MTTENTEQAPDLGIEGADGKSLEEQASTISTSDVDVTKPLTKEELEKSMGNIMFQHQTAKMEFDFALNKAANKTSKRILKLITQLEPEVSDCKPEEIHLLGKYNTLIYCSKVFRVLKKKLGDLTKQDEEEKTDE